MPSDFYNILKATALAQIAAASDPNPWDISAFLALRAKTCKHTVHPQDAYPPPINKPLKWEAFHLTLQTFAPIVKSYQADVKDLVVDTENRTVVARLRIRYVLKGIPEGEGELELEKMGVMDSVWVTEMDESGEKIVRMEECVDPAELMREGGLMDRGTRYNEWVHRDREQESD